MRYLLVDRITEVLPDRRIAGWKNAAMSEDYFEWHFPELPIVPGMLVLEACAQLAGWLEAASSGFERWVLLDRVHSARYYGFAVPGDRLELSVERVEAAAPASAERRAYRAESLVLGERRATLDFEAHVVPVEDLDARERIERTFKMLRGERPAELRGRRGRA